MTSLVITMIVVLAVAAGALVFAAFPHRGEHVPGARWLGDALGRAADAVPTLDEDGDPAVDDAEADAEAGAEAGAGKRTFADAFAPSSSGRGDRDASAEPASFASPGRRP